MAEIPKQYKACCYDAPGKNSIEIRSDMEVPEPGPGEVLINLTHSGVCHSDYALMMNAWPSFPAPTPKDQVGGHEGVGKIVKLGPGAEIYRKVGDRVGIKWIANACGNCVACLSGYESSCTNGRKVSGYFNPGTFQQYVLSSAHYVTPIPDNVDSAAAAPMLCAGVTTYSALRQSGLQHGQTVAILGAGGGLGHLAVQMAAKGMAYEVIGVDHSSKESFVLDAGAKSFIAIDKTKDLTADVKAASNGLGVHAVIVLTGSNAAYASALAMLRFGGRLVVVGIPEGEQHLIAGATPIGMIFGGKQIVGVGVGNRKDAIECLDMVAKGIIKVHYRTEKMEKLQDVFEEMEAAKLLGRVVLDLS